MSIDELIARMSASQRMTIAHELDRMAQRAFDDDYDREGTPALEQFLEQLIDRLREP